MKKEGLILGGIGLVTLLIVVGAAFLLSGPSSQTPSSTTDATADPVLLLGPEDQRASIGSPSAKVTVVEFGDFQCPACAAAYPIVHRIQEEYKDRVYFVFRDFPLPQHQNGALSAQAAYAAGLQGKFWEMHDRLYESQEEWGEKSNARETITTYAQEIGLNLEEFNKALDDKAGESNIQKDQNDGYQLGVNSTPTFFINGEKFSGVLTYDDFKKELDSRLK